MNGTTESKVKPTRAMKAMLKNSEEHTIIGIHNHPGSSTPSIDDIMVAVDRKYKYGIVACHNGTVYKYSINGEVNVVNADIYLAKLDGVIYNGDEDEIAKVLSQLSESGVDLEVY